ncbi:sugar phosphate permease [Halopolyspora algeriensis]|uniref:Sugar phosphate permease n=1 Tax=Halopolyspora algeriensis TaxID=1500506 RepID=A0A368VH37_9ACTN|nr:MFS transporter [Halopolyspora algeriensis]RCW39630.1 sugar phosphate permease [Halopolyspora algeriensis]TQM54076.1 sugar phosphate permease [Halopolyspora algeriensis]
MTSTRQTAATPDPSRQHEDQPSLNTREMRRILASSFIGSLIEYYDFLLYATAAAIVFSQLFFTNLGPGFAAFASFGTLAAGYVARPLGGAVFGHFGDRVGRKNVLVISMLTMGIATCLIGLLPTTAQIGVIAPVLLIVLRIIQGLAVGGEWGGAMLMALEHAPKKKRGFAASFANMGAPAGAALATLAVSAVTLLPQDQFLSWGWRIPFLLSVVLVTVGLVIRLKVAETPLFRQLQDMAEAKKLPLLEVVTRNPKNLVLGIITGTSVYTIAGMVTVWAVSYAVGSGADKTGVLNAKAAAAVVMFLVVIISARVSDRFGRKPVMLTGMIGAAVCVFPILWLVESGTVWGFAIAVMLGQGLQGVIFGPFGAFTAELFPTHMRYTGASLAYQSASTLGAGFTPAIATGLVLTAGGSLTFLGTVWILAFAVAAAAILLTREGSTRDLTTMRAGSGRE